MIIVFLCTILINMLFEKCNKMIEWKTSKNLISFEESEDLMNNRLDKILCKKEKELIWFLEHESFYTFGKSANKKDLIDPFVLPCHEVKRGGSYTYHGPGQRVVYLMLNLKNYGSDVRRFVWMLEEWVIKTLAYFKIFGKRIKGKVGVWLDEEIHENHLSPIPRKISAVGLRLKRWISYYGISINVNPDLDKYKGIIACGNKGFGVTSLHNEGVFVSLEEFDFILKKNFHTVFL